MKLAGFADDDAAQFNNFYDKLNQMTIETS